MRALMLLLVLLIIAPAVDAQPVIRIRLNAPKHRAATSGIRVTGVRDLRSDTAIIGTMRAGLANRTRQVSLEGGVAAAVHLLIGRYQNPEADAVPVTVELRELNISEEALRMKQRLTIRYKYAYIGDAGELSYEGTAFAESNVDVSGYIERLVRESLTTTFDKVAEAWQVPDPAVPSRVRVVVNVEPQPANTGLISYDRNRPLSYDDFKGPLDDLSLGAAATYTGMTFGYSAQQSGPDFQIIVTLSAIADPEKSWMRSSGRLPKVLAHENLHFAITALMVCRLADTLRQTAVTKDDYEPQLRKLFNAVERQQQRAQQLYDKETRHGTIPQQQAEWEKWIYEELKRYGCFGH